MVKAIFAWMVVIIRLGKAPARARERERDGTMHSEKAWATVTYKNTLSGSFSGKQKHVICSIQFLDPAKDLHGR